MEYKWINKEKRRKLSISIKRNDIFSECGLGITYLKGGHFAGTKSWWINIYMIFFKINLHYFAVKWSQK